MSLASLLITRSGREVGVAIAPGDTWRKHNTNDPGFVIICHPSFKDRKFYRVGVIGCESERKQMPAGSWEAAGIRGALTISAAYDSQDPIPPSPGVLMSTNPPPSGRASASEQALKRCPPPGDRWGGVSRRQARADRDLLTRSALVSAPEP